MNNREAYEEQIVKALGRLPQAALREVLRVVTAVSDGYRARSEGPVPRQEGLTVAHERARRLLATSERNWAHDVIRDREDRL
jgi:hypothetical protein